MALPVIERMHTEFEVIRHNAPPGESFVVLNGFPGVPTSKVIQNITSAVLDLMPLQNRYSNSLCESLHVEDFAEVYGWFVPTYVRGHKHGYDGYSVRDHGKVYEIDLRLQLRWL